MELADPLEELEYEKNSISMLPLFRRVTLILSMCYQGFTPGADRNIKVLPSDDGRTLGSTVARETEETSRTGLISEHEGERGSYSGGTASDPADEASPRVYVSASVLQPPSRRYRRG